MSDNKEIQKEITTLKVEQAGIKKDITHMMTNCIPTVQRTVDKVDKRVWIILVSIIISTLIGIGMKLLMK